MQIEMDKKYKTRSGLDAEILKIGYRDEMVVVNIKSKSGNNKNDVIYYYNMNGALMCQSNSRVSNPAMDLVEDTPWSHIEIDAPVYVSTYGNQWYKRHFSGVVNGRPTTWCNGATSHSADEHFTFWAMCLTVDEYEKFMGQNNVNS